MAIVTYQIEQVHAVTPNRMFKAYVDAVYVFPFPKVSPKITNIEYFEGNRGPRTIQKVTYVGDTYMTFKIESYDQDTLTYNYSVIEGEPIKGPLEKITLENKFVASPTGGCICKTTASYHLKSDAVISVDKLYDAKERNSSIFNAIETYLLNRPDAFN